MLTSTPMASSTAIANSRAAPCGPIQVWGRREALRASQWGKGCEPSTLSTTIFNGRGNSNVSGKERKLRKAIAERCGQQLRHSPSNRIKAERRLVFFPNANKCHQVRRGGDPQRTMKVRQFYVSYLPSGTSSQLP